MPKSRSSVGKALTNPQMRTWTITDNGNAHCVFPEVCRLFDFFFRRLGVLLLDAFHPGEESFLDCLSVGVRKLVGEEVVFGEDQRR
jgi:hypothetical protein